MEDNLLSDAEKGESCRICEYQLILDDKWKCPTCRQELHEYCFNKHKETNGNNCPFCRTVFSGENASENETTPVRVISEISISERLRIIFITMGITTAGVVLFLGSTDCLR